jgi:hypothetical protein
MGNPDRRRFASVNGAIVPRMVDIRAVREVETWTGPNVLGGILLLVVVLALLIWAIRRYVQR